MRALFQELRAAAALDPHPANLTSVAAQVGDDYLFWRISEGRPGTAMVGWGTTLTEEQIWQVIAFIHSLGVNLSGIFGLELTHAFEKWNFGARFRIAR